MVCGRHWSEVEALAQLDYVRPVLSVRKSRELAALGRRLSRGSHYGVSVHRSLLDAEVVAWLCRHVAVLMTWPINDLPSLDQMVDIGVNGIISDDSAVLAELLRR